MERLLVLASETGSDTEMSMCSPAILLTELLVAQGGAAGEQDLPRALLTSARLQTLFPRLLVPQTDLQLSAATLRLLLALLHVPGARGFLLRIPDLSSRLRLLGQTVAPLQPLALRALQLLG